MPVVASDLIVQRPQRPESVSGRAGAPSADPSDPTAPFGALLAEATTPTGVAVTPQAADTPIIGQIGQPSSDKPEASTATPAVKPALQPTQPATVQANQLFAVLAEATAITPASNPTAAATKTDVATAAKVKLAKPSEGTDDASAAVTVDPAAVASAAVAPPPVPVAVVVPAPAIALVAAVPAPAFSSIKPVESTPTPAVPTPAAPASAAPAADLPAAEVAAAPEAAAQPIAPAVSQPNPGTQAITPAAPQAKPTTANLSAALQLKPDTVATPAAAAELETNAEVASPTTAPEAKLAAGPATVSEKPASADTVETSLKAAVSLPPESVAPKAQPQAEGKPDTAGKAKTEIKTDQHGRIVRAAANSRADAAPVAPSLASDTPAGPQTKPDGVGPARGHSADQDATPIRVPATETRDAALALAAPQAASTPTPSFNLAAPALAVPAIGPVNALRVDANSPAVPVDGLAVEIVSRAQDGLRRFEIRLDPPELGRIDVRLDVDEGGKVTSHLRVERSDTLDLLRRDAPQLERALQQTGLNTDGGLQFSLRDRSFAHRDQTPGDGTNATRLIIPEDDSIAAEAARRGYGRLVGLGGGVDIRI